MLDIGPPSPRNREIINALLQPSPPEEDDVFMTPAELSERHRMKESTLANLRYRGEGIPFVKLPSGAILYRLADVLAAEHKGTVGFSWSWLNDSLALMPGISDTQRAAIVDHLKKTMR